MTIRQMLLGGIALGMINAGPALALDQITVAVFPEWPLPLEYARAKGLYDEALGIKVNWRSFDTGTAMIAAMASGDVQMAVGMAVPPVVTSASAGQEVQIVDLAVSYSDNENCVIRSDLDISAANIRDLVGKKVALPLGTVTHFSFLKQIAHFGLNPGDVQIVDMAPAEGAAALSQGAVDVACGWGGGLLRMKESGEVLMTGAEKEKLGILVVDFITAPRSFTDEHPDLVEAFLKVTDQANTAWTEGTARDEMLPVIATGSGMEETAAATTLALFTFPTIEERLSAKWLGGGVQTYMKGVADLFAQTGNIPKTLDSYDAFVNAGPLKAAAAE